MREEVAAEGEELRAKVAREGGEFAASLMAYEPAILAEDGVPFGLLAAKLALDGCANAKSDRTLALCVTTTTNLC